MRFPRLLPLAAVLPLGLAAVQTGVLVDEGYADLFRGELTNVSLSRAGELGTAPHLTEVTRLSEPFVWKVIADGADGFFIGTGISGKVLHLDAEGVVTERFAPDSALSRALAVDEEGNLFVGTSPNGAIYRLPAAGGKPELFFNPEAIYLWDLAVSEGALWITTGKPAQLLRLPLDGSAKEPEVWFEARDEHLTALARREGAWLLGSSPRGIVYAVSGRNDASAILKANEKEIRALAPAADGSLLIATYSDEAPRTGTPSTPDPNELPPLVVNAAGGSGSGRGSGPGSLESRGGSGYLLRLDRDGIARAEWRSTEGGIFSLAPVNDRLWLLGFSREGKLYGFADRHDWELIQQMPRGGEISAIVPEASRSGSFLIFTSNPGAVYRLGGEGEAESAFRSRVLDARQAVTWGRLETSFAAVGEVTIETRAGFTDEPDSTWSAWAALDGELIASPRGRFLQYRLRFPAGSEARFLRARAFHAMPNAAPLVSEVKILDFGAELRVAQVNPQMIDFSAVFSPAQRERFEQGGIERMKLERRPEPTLRTLVWRATDPNGDTLTFDLFFREASARDWTVLARELSDPLHVFNTAGLAPGHYQFRVVASDAPSNARDQALTAELRSALVLLNARPPVLEALPLSDDGRTFGFVARAGVSRIVGAQIVIDGGDPIALRPVDGIFDSPTEEFRHTLAVAPDAPLDVLCAVLDESGNQAVLTLRLDPTGASD
jgi:hypothetical protein